MYVSRRLLRAVSLLCGAAALWCLFLSLDSPTSYTFRCYRLRCPDDELSKRSEDVGSSKMHTRGFQHVTLAVRDLARSEKFYEEILRLPKLKRPLFDFPGTWYDLGNGVELHLIVTDLTDRNGDGTKGRDRDPLLELSAGIHSQHVAIQVDSLADAQQWLSAIAAPFIVISPRVDGAQQLYLTDPDGHTWEIVQLPDGADLGHDKAWPEPIFVRGAVVSAENTLVSGAAVDILQRGGSAADAAIAANAVQSVIEPMNCGIGGDLMAFVMDGVGPHARMDAPVLIDSSGRSPLGLTKEMLRRLGHVDEMPERGPLTITTPGAVRGWCEMHRQFGRLQWSSLFDSAITVASEGFIVTRHIEKNWVFYDDVMDAADRGLMSRDSKAAFVRTYSIDGRKPRYGERMRNTALAGALRAIQAGGCDEFYAGNLTSIIVAELQAQGSAIDQRDFDAHRTRSVVKKPLQGTFRGRYDLYVPPPPAQGFVALEMLKMLEILAPTAASDSTSSRNRIADTTQETANYLHMLIEIKKAAYLDAAQLSGGDELKASSQALDDENMAVRTAAVRRALTTRRASRFSSNPTRFSRNPIEDTVGMAIADSRGMMVTLLQSVYHPFGSGVVVPSLGFVTNARAHLFALGDPSHPNHYAPGKQPFTTLMPTFLFRDGRPWMAYSGKGGDRQPQTLMQVVSNLVDRGMSLQAAINHPRFRHTGSEHPARFNITKYNSNPVHLRGGTVNFDNGGFGEAVERDLAARGHVITGLDFFHDSHFAVVNAIVADGQGGYKSATDFLRKPGLVASLSMGTDGDLSDVRLHILTRERD
eukprot:Opistho-2@85863